MARSEGVYIVTQALAEQISVDGDGLKITAVDSVTVPDADCRNAVTMKLRGGHILMLDDAGVTGIADKSKQFDPAFNDVDLNVGQTAVLDAGVTLGGRRRVVTVSKVADNF